MTVVWIRIVSPQTYAQPKYLYANCKNIGYEFSSIYLLQKVHGLVALTAPSNKSYLIHFLFVSTFDLLIVLFPLFSFDNAQDYNIDFPRGQWLGMKEV